MFARMMLLCIFLIIASVNAAGSRTLCYSGSDMYQRLTMDCNALDPAYQGNWYCAKVTICEQYISSSRNCITTRGCAKDNQCQISGGGIYSGLPLAPGGEYPAGMTITPSCCSNSQTFATDDGALDYSLICNNVARGVTFNAATVAIITMMSCLVSLLI